MGEYSSSLGKRKSSAGGSGQSVAPSKVLHASMVPLL